jgi:opacity protein-like surface antigen
MNKIWMRLPLLLVLVSSPILAEDFKRFEFQPLAGFSVSGSIPLLNENNEHVGSIHVNSSYHVGANFAVNLNAEDALEVHWQRQFTEGRLPENMVAPFSSAEVLSFKLKVDQYHLNFVHHYEIADPKARPYVMAALGATTFYGDRDGYTNSQSRFSFAIGGGMKYYFTSYFGLRGEARWSPTLLLAEDSKFWCSIGGSGANCRINLKTSFQHQLDLTGGVVFRF